MSKMIINGVCISGNSIVVTNGRVVIDGKDMTPDSKHININVEGDVDTISVDCCEKIIVAGNAGSVETSSGDVDCHDVTGSVQTTSGDIECGNVGGSVQTTSGDVKCDQVAGNVKTISGDIKNKK